MKKMMLAIALFCSSSLFAQNEYIQPKGLAPGNGYTHVVVTQPGKLIFVSGQVGNDIQGQILGKGDLKTQADRVFANLNTALASVGATFNDVVKISFYVKDFKPSDLPALRDARNKYVNKDNPPASTLIGVQSLFRDDCLIEVEAIAVIPEKKK